MARVTRAADFRRAGGATARSCSFWRPDATTLMVADVNSDGARLRGQRRQEALRHAISRIAPYHAFDVSADGQRILVNSLLLGPGGTPRVAGLASDDGDEIRRGAGVPLRGSDRPHQPLRDVVGAVRRHTREADSQLALAGLIARRTCSPRTNAMDSASACVCTLRRLVPSSQPAPQVQSAVRHGPLQHAGGAVPLERADHRVAPAPVFRPQLDEVAGRTCRRPACPRRSADSGSACADRIAA